MQAKLEMSQKNEMRLSNELEQMRAKGTSLGKWVCSVCGYVHTGGSPPHYCPQCKAPPSKYKEQTASMYDNTNSVHIARDISIGEWVCSVCGYVHTGVNAPDSCPQCKAPSSKFKAALLAMLEEAEKREAELRVELEEAKRQKTEKQGGGVPALLARLEEAEKRKADLLDKQTRIK
jgi:rubrerythrin